MGLGSTKIAIRILAEFVVWTTEISLWQATHIYVTEWLIIWPHCNSYKLVALRPTWRVFRIEELFSFLDWVWTSFLDWTMPNSRKFNSKSAKSSRLVPLDSGLSISWTHNDIYCFRESHDVSLGSGRLRRARRRRRWLGRASLGHAPDQTFG